jgi:hypothetical protein
MPLIEGRRKNHAALPAHKNEIPSGWASEGISLPRTVV